MKRVIIGLVLCCGWVLVCGRPGLAQETPKETPKSEPKEVIEVTVDKLNMRTDAATSFPVVHTLKKGEKLVVVSRKEGWIEVVLPDDASCWVAKKFVEPKGEGKGIIKSNDVNIRFAADFSETSVIGKANRDTEVTILKEEEQWYKIAPLPHLSAWVSEKHTKFWGKYEDYLKEIDKIKKEKAEAKKKDAELKEALAKAEETYKIYEGIDKGQIETYLKYLPDFKAALETYRRVAKESDDKKMAALAKERSQELGPVVRLLTDISDLLARKDEAMRNNAQVYQKAYDEILAKITEEIKKHQHPYIATGTVGYVGVFNNRPGTHRLVKGEETIYFLRCDNKAVDLDKYAGKEVGVNGQVVENKGWAQRTIIINSAEDIKELGKEEKTEE